MTHDLHVSAIYFKLCRENPAEAAGWVLDNDSRPCGEGAKFADAEIHSPRGTPLKVIEFGGGCSRERLRKVHGVRPAVNFHTSFGRGGFWTVPVALNETSRAFLDLVHRYRAVTIDVVMAALNPISESAAKLLLKLANTLHLIRWEQRHCTD